MDRINMVRNRHTLSRIITARHRLLRHGLADISHNLCLANIRSHTNNNRRTEANLLTDKDRDLDMFVMQTWVDWLQYNGQQLMEHSCSRVSQAHRVSILLNKAVIHHKGNTVVLPLSQQGLAK
jgi:hypothetical protein